jgi:hypothetical protein
MVILNVALQALITYAPGVQDVWETEGINGFDWLRILLFAFAIFGLVELEKAYGPAIVRPYVMPAIRRINAALGCGARRGPKPFVLDADAIARTVSNSEKAARATLSSRDLTHAQTNPAYAHGHGHGKEGSGAGGTGAGVPSSPAGSSVSASNAGAADAAPAQVAVTVA